MRTLGSIVVIFCNNFCRSPLLGILRNFKESIQNVIGKVEDEILKDEIFFSFEEFDVFCLDKWNTNGYGESFVKITYYVI